MDSDWKTPEKIVVNVDEKIDHKSTLLSKDAEPEPGFFGQRSPGPKIIIFRPIFEHLHD